MLQQVYSHRDKLTCIVRASCMYTSALTGLSWLLASFSSVLAVANLTQPSSIWKTMLGESWEFEDTTQVSMQGKIWQDRAGQNRAGQGRAE